MSTPESRMRFFTSDLYIRFNSPDDDVADQANEEWEAALTEYREHLESICPEMPPPVRQLSTVCFHDAELLTRSPSVEPFLSGLEPTQEAEHAVAIVSLRQDDQVVSLFYSLWDQIRESPPPEHWPFSEVRPHWLYDEIDLAPNGREGFQHRVLLSDGRVLEIPFTSAFIHTVSLTA